MSMVTLDPAIDTVVLPPPAFPPGASLEAALRNRRSTRAFRADALPLQVLSTLLWAGCGVNRRDSGNRTAPSAHNWQEIAVFAVMADGAYRYDAAGHRLARVSTEDLRSLTGLQDFVGNAPLNLVYVADFARMHDVQASEQSFFCGADAAFMAQNVSLYCASVGLATVVRAMVDRRRLAAALKLAPTERIALAQTVGLPAPAP
jgi:nitroreductase